MTTPIINIQSKLLAPNNVAQFRQQLQNAVKGVSASVKIDITKGAAGNLNKLSAAAQKLSNNLNTLNQTAAKTNSILNNLGNVKNLGSVTAQVNSLQSAMSSMAKAANTTKASLNGFGTVANNATRNVGGTATQFNNLANAATKIVNPTSRASSNVNSFSKSVNQTNTHLKTTSIQLELTARRFLAFAAVSRPIIAINQAFEKGVQEAIKYQKELVTLKQVGGDTSAVIDGLSDHVRELATGLGVSSADLIKTANVLRQAGLSINDINKSLDALAKTTLAPNFDDLTETVEGFIAVNSQFGGSIDETIKSLSKINTVASAYAAESSDLITSVQKTGAAFKAAGGSIEELIGIVTAVRSTTRESADTIATGLRTIIARTQRLGTITELKQFGIDITANAEQAKRLGIAVGDILPVFERFRVISQGVSGFSESDPRFAQIIELVGGIRQLSKTIPLLKEFNKAQEATNLAIIGGNSLNRDAETAQKSLSVQLTKLTESFNKLFDTFGRNESIRAFIDLTIKGADAAIKLTEALEPIAPILLSIAAAGAIQVGSGLLGSLKNGIPVNIRQNTSRPVRRNRGGVIPGPKSVNKDTVPALVGQDDYILRKSATQALDLNGGIENILAMLTPGEYHIPAEQARKIGYGNLDRLNAIGTSGSFKNNKKIQALLERIRKEENPGVRYALKRNYISLGGDPTFIKGYAKGGRVRDVAAQLGIGLDVLKSVASDYGIPLPKDSKGRFGASAKIDDALATRIENALRFSSQVIDAPIRTNQLPVYQSARKPSQFEKNLSKEARRRASNQYRTFQQGFRSEDANVYRFDTTVPFNEQFYRTGQPNLTGVNRTTQQNLNDEQKERIRIERMNRNAARTGFNPNASTIPIQISESASILANNEAARLKNEERRRRAANAARVGSGSPDLPGNPYAIERNGTVSRVNQEALRNQGIDKFVKEYAHQKDLEAAIARDAERAANDIREAIDKVEAMRKQAAASLQRQKEMYLKRAAEFARLRDVRDDDNFFRVASGIAGYDVTRGSNVRPINGLNRPSPDQSLSRRRFNFEKQVEINQQEILRRSDPTKLALGDTRVVNLSKNQYVKNTQSQKLGRDQATTQFLQTISTNPAEVNRYRGALKGLTDLYIKQIQILRPGIDNVSASRRAEALARRELSRNTKFQQSGFLGDAANLPGTTGITGVRNRIRFGVSGVVNRFSRANARFGNTGLGRTLSNPLTGIGLGLAGGYIAPTNTADTTGNLARAGGSGALIGAGTGAALGSFLGPIGAGVGALGGAAIGAAVALKDFSEKVAQSKFNIILDNFTAKLNSINLGNDGIDVRESESINSLLKSIQKESSRRFGSDFAGRQQFVAEQFGGLGLDKILTQIIEKNNIGSVKELRDFNGGTGANLLKALAQGNRTDQGAIEKAYERIIASNLDMKKVKKATENFSRAVDDTALMFETLSRTIDAEIINYERNTDNLSRFTAGDGSPFKAGAFANRDFAGRAQIIGSSLGPQGTQLANQALGFNTLKSALPGIIRNIVSNTNDPDTIEDRFQKSISAVQGVPDTIKSRFISAFDTISEDLIKNGAGGIEEAVRTLADNSFPGLIEAIDKGAEAIQNQLESFVEGLGTVRGFDTQIRDLGINQVELRRGRARNRLDALGLNPVLNQTNTFAARQNALLGGSASAYDVGGIANALRDTQNQINDEQKRAADTGDTSIETAKKISDLRYRAEDLTTALRNLTDVTLTTADAQERLAAIQNEKNARLGFSEQVLRNSPFQNAQLRNTAEMARVATFTGLEAFDSTSINRILDFFQQLGDVTFENGLTGNKIAENLISNTSVGFANRVPQFAQQALNERGQIDKGFETAQQATEALQKQTTDNRNNFFNELIKTNNDFLAGLKDSIIAALRENNAKQVAGAQGTVDANNIVSNLIKNLQGKGVNVQGASDLVNSGKIASLLDKRTQISGIAQNIRDVNANLPNFERKQFTSLKGFGNSRFTDIDVNKVNTIVGEYLNNNGFSPEEIKTAIDSIVNNLKKDSSRDPNSIIRSAINNIGINRIRSTGFFGDLRDSAASANISQDQLIDILALPKEDRDALNKVAEAIQSAGGKIEQFTNKITNDAQRLDDLKAQGYATGGYVSGRGNKDSVRANLMPGEFVINKAATSRNLGALQYLNSGGTARKTLFERLTGQRLINELPSALSNRSILDHETYNSDEYQAELQKTLEARRNRRSRRNSSNALARRNFANYFGFGDNFGGSHMSAHQFFYGQRQMSAREFLYGNYYANGGSVFKPRGSDTVPAMLTPGEFIVNANATKKFLPTLKQMNAQYRADGGIINNSSGINSLNLNDFGRDLIKPLNDFTQSFALMGKVFSEMNSKVGELANSLSNMTMRIEGKQTVEVVVNGAAVLAGITGEVRSIVNDAVREAINAKFNDDKFNGIPN